MTHISKHPLPPRARAQVDRQFIDVFIAHSTKQEIGQLVRELFTSTELVMFAKRTAVIALLERGYSSYEIAAMLKVSSSTVRRIERYRQGGRYRHIERVCERKRSRESLLSLIEQLLAAGLPPRGRGRWSRTFREIDAWRAGGR